MQTKKQLLWLGTAFQQVIPDQSLHQREYFSVNVGLVCITLSICYHKRWLCEVPVVVLWTKTDCLDDDKVIQLIDEGSTISEAMQQAPQQAWAEYENDVHQRFEAFEYPPKAYVVFRSECQITLILITILANCVAQICMNLEQMLNVWLK